MIWQEKLDKWKEITSSRLQIALHRFRAKETTPVAASERVSQLSLGELLSSQQAVRQGLNDALNQTLTLDALPAGDARYFNRSGQLEQLSETLDAWRAGQPRMIACFGPHGSGVSSLLNQIECMVEPDTVLRHHTQHQHLKGVEDVLALCAELFDLAQPPASTDEALTLVRQASRRIVIIDNAHQFSLRVAGNAPQMRALGLLMVASRDLHFWVLGFNQEAWNRLIYVYGADRYFTDLIPLTLFNQEELVGMLAHRFTIAGVSIGVKAEDSDNTESNASLPGEPLMRLSNGHPRLAIALLINSLSAGEHPQSVTLSLLKRLDTEIFNALLPQDLFALAEIAVHGALTAAEHRAIFRCPITESQMVMADLHTRQLLARQPCQHAKGDTYCLEPMVVSLVTAYLHQKNFLY